MLVCDNTVARLRVIDSEIVDFEKKAGEKLKLFYVDIYQRLFWPQLDQLQSFNNSLLNWGSLSYREMRGDQSLQNIPIIAVYGYLVDMFSGFKPIINLANDKKGVARSYRDSFDYEVVLVSTEPYLFYGSSELRFIDTMRRDCGIPELLEIDPGYLYILPNCNKKQDEDEEDMDRSWFGDHVFISKTLKRWLAITDNYNYDQIFAGLTRMEEFSKVLEAEKGDRSMLPKERFIELARQFG